MTNNAPALIGALFIVAAFVWLLMVFRAPSHVKRVLAVSQEAAAALQAANATDEEKERAAQQSSLKLFGLFFLILISFSGAVLAPVAVLWVLDRLHLVSLKAILATTMSVTFLVTVTVVGCAAAFLWPKLRDRFRGGSRGGR